MSSEYESENEREEESNIDRSMRNLIMDLYVLIPPKLVKAAAPEVARKILTTFLKEIPNDDPKALVDYKKLIEFYKSDVGIQHLTTTFNEEPITTAAAAAAADVVSQSSSQSVVSPTTNARDRLSVLLQVALELSNQLGDNEAKQALLGSLNIARYVLDMQPQSQPQGGASGRASGRAAMTTTTQAAASSVPTGTAGGTTTRTRSTNQSNGIRRGGLDLGGARLEDYPEPTTDEERALTGTLYSIYDFGILDYLDGDDTTFTKVLLVHLTAKPQIVVALKLMAFGPSAQEVQRIKNELMSASEKSRSGQSVAKVVGFFTVPQVILHEAKPYTMAMILVLEPDELPF